MLGTGIASVILGNRPESYRNFGRRRGFTKFPRGTGDRWQSAFNGTCGRKVRAPLSKVLVNDQAAGSRGPVDGQCNRKQTASFMREQSRMKAVRAKGWGKSPPHPRRRGWHGKPYLEQDQIGEHARTAVKRRARGISLISSRVRSLEACGNAGPRGMIASGRKAEDRTRLTVPRGIVFDGWRGRAAKTAG